MRLFLASVALLAGCATDWDPHKPRTIDAEPAGGAVSLKHGQRLHVPLAAAQSGYEWTIVGPRVVAVIAEGPPAAEGLYFTPVRSGAEKLRIERRRAPAGGAPEQVLTYDITVR